MVRYFSQSDNKAVGDVAGGDQRRAEQAVAGEAQDQAHCHSQGGA